jgi:hypothetical protein
MIRKEMKRSPWPLLPTPCSIPVHLCAWSLSQSLGTSAFKYVWPLTQHTHTHANTHTHTYHTQHISHYQQCHKPFTEHISYKLVLFFLPSFSFWYFLSSSSHQISSSSPIRCLRSTISQPFVDPKWEHQTAFTGFESTPQTAMLLGKRRCS